MLLTPTAQPERFNRIACFAIFLAALALNLWFAKEGWDRTLFDTHPFRQAQTALTAFWMIRDGIHLDYATPVLGAPWSIPMEFPFYQATVASIVNLTGLPLVPAGRGVSLGYFYASLPAIWLLLRRLGISKDQRWIFLALVLTSPLYIFYSRTFLIESTAFFFGIWFLYFFHRSLDERAWGSLAGAAVFGAVTALAKITTYAVFLAPAFALGVFMISRKCDAWKRLLLRGGLAAVPGIAIGAWWVAHTDAVKSKNILGAHLTSNAQRAWNYGPFLQRFEPAFWRDFGMHLERAVFPAGALLLFFVMALLFLRGRRVLFVSLAAIALAGPLVFTNLYFVHDYYLYASGIFFLAAMALPLQRLMEQEKMPPAVRLTIVAIVLAVQFRGYFQFYYQQQITAAVNPPEIVQALKAVTPADDVMLGLGLNWTSIFPYYAERKAVMVPDIFSRDGHAIDQALANLGSSRVAVMILGRQAEPGPEFYAPWLKKLEMDENPFLQTGEFTVHIRKDLLPAALKRIGSFPLKDVLLYQGQLGKPNEKPPIIYWLDQLADRSFFTMMSPQPTKVMVPFGLGSERIGGHLTFTAHTPTEIEIPVPTGARHISAIVGLNPRAYDRSDGFEVEITVKWPKGAHQKLYHRFIQPAVLVGDRGPQTIEIETAEPMEGSIVFDTLPGGNPNFDWAYWSKIEIH